MSRGIFAGSVMRVVEILSSAEGIPGELASARYCSRHRAMLTTSMPIAPSGQAEEQAGLCTSVSIP